MATAAVRGRLNWRVAQILEIVDETPTVRTLRLHVPEWPGHRPGQHVDVRLTAPDGYTAQRSYSIATPAPPQDGDGTGASLDITVERLDDGEVSPYLAGVAEVGDEVELRGPIGGYFVWEPELGPEPVLLVGGGSGVVPLMAMIRARAIAVREGVTGVAPMRLLLSSRTHGEIIYRVELDELAARGDGFELVHTLTRGAPDGWAGRIGRVDRALLAEVGWPATDPTRAFVCGPTPFVEVVASGLVALRYARDRIRTERFGATGAPS